MLTDKIWASGLVYFLTVRIGRVPSPYGVNEPILNFWFWLRRLWNLTHGLLWGSQRGCDVRRSRRATHGLFMLWLIVSTLLLRGLGCLWHRQPA